MQICNPLSCQPHVPAKGFLIYLKLFRKWYFGLVGLEDFVRPQKMISYDQFIFFDFAQFPRLCNCFQRCSKLCTDISFPKGLVLIQYRLKKQREHIFGKWFEYTPACMTTYHLLCNITWFLKCELLMRFDLYFERTDKFETLICSSSNITNFACYAIFCTPFPWGGKLKKKLFKNLSILWSLLY